MSQTLYRLFDANQKLLYVGISMRAWARLHEHSDSKNWWAEVKSIVIEHFETREAVAQAEIEAIISENPKHNITYSKDTFEKLAAQGAFEKLDSEQKIVFVIGRLQALGCINDEITHMQEFIDQPQTQNSVKKTQAVNGLAKTYSDYQEVWLWYRNGLDEIVAQDFDHFTGLSKNKAAFNMGIQWVANDLQNDAIAWCDGLGQKHLFPHSNSCLGLTQLASALTNSFECEETK